MVALPGGNGEKYRQNDFSYLKIDSYLKPYAGLHDDALIFQSYSFMNRVATRRRHLAVACDG
jgi:hypothetical protein